MTSFPASPPCHSRRFLAGIQGLSLRSLPSCTSPSGKKPLDSRLKMSGMTGGALGMTEWTSARLRINRRPYILYPTVLCPSRRVPSVRPVRGLSVRPARVPLSVPPGSLCPSRRVPSVRPVGPPLSFPQVFSGNPGSFSSAPSFGWLRLGKNPGFPIKNVGNDRGGVGKDRGDIGKDGGTPGRTEGASAGLCINR